MSRAGVPKWVKLRSTKDLMVLGYKITHMADDGSYIRFGKGGTEMGLGTDLQYEAHEVVNHGTIHENAINLFPDAFVEVESPEVQN